MIRMLTGTAVAAAIGRIAPVEIDRLLDPDRRRVGDPRHGLEAPEKPAAGWKPAPRTSHCAPADGLTLVEVEYEEPSGAR